MKFKTIKKWIAALAMAAMLSPVLTPLHANAYTGILYINDEVSTLTSGVTYTESTRLYKEGWLQLYVLTIDLTDPNVKLDVLLNYADFGVKQSVEALVKNNGAVAGVNADFFNSGNPTSSLGIEISDGKVLASNNYNNYDSFNQYSLLLDKSGIGFIDSIKTRFLGFFITDLNTTIIQVSGKNKITSSMSQAIYYDATPDTSQLDKRFSNLTKILVVDNTITYISSPGEVVNIPENGYAIVIPKAVADEHLSNYYVGQSVYFSETYEFMAHPNKPAYEVEMGITGGGRFLLDGQPVQTGLMASPGARNPRTLVGVNQDRTKVIVMAVDGRSSSSIGATNSECAALMQQYGAYDAIHLDGGGSTTMVVKEEGATEATLQNVPSDGSQRLVPNGLGVFSQLASDELGGFIMDLPYSTTNTIMAERGATLSVQPYNIYHNLLNFDISQVTYGNEGIEGTWNGNVFYPTSTGWGQLTASYGEVTSALDVLVVGKPIATLITPSTVSVEVGGTKQLSVSLVNEDGYTQAIGTNNVTWESLGEQVSVNAEGVVTGVSNGQALVMATYNEEVVGYAQVSVGRTTKPVMSFENGEQVLFSSNQTGVTGSAKVVEGVKYDGNHSLQLTYKFMPNVNALQTAVALVEPANIALTEDNGEKPSALNMWVVGDQSGYPLKSIIKDAAGKYHTVQLSSSLDFGVWQYVSGALPSDIVYPAKVEKIFVSTESTGGTVVERTLYIDHISATYTATGDKNFQKTNGFSDPQHTILTDQAPAGQFDITVFGPTAVYTGDANKLSILQNVKNKMVQNNPSVSIFTGYTDTAQTQLSGPTVLRWMDQYAMDQYGDVKIIHLATSKGSITSNNPDQWVYLQKELNADDGKHVIVVMNKDLLDGSSYTATKEGAILIKLFNEFAERTGKDIFVISGIGNENSITVKDGVRYIRLNGLNGASYVDYDVLRIRSTGDGLQYQLQNVYE